MIAIWFVLVYVAGVVTSALYLHIMGIRENLDWEIDAALRRQYENGYWTRAMEEVGDE